MSKTRALRKKQNVCHRHAHFARSRTYANFPAPSLWGETLAQCCGEQHYLAAPWFELPIDKDDVVKMHIE